MEIVDVKQMIKTGKYSEYLIFAGEEGTVQKTYIDMIAKKGNYKLVYVDEIAEVYSKLRIKSLVDSKTLYVVFNDKEFLKNEKAWDALTGFKDDLVIFQYLNVDKRLKFWKYFKDRAVFFERLSDRVLVKHIQKKLGIFFDEDSCKKLIEVCEGDYGRIMLEADKIERYARYKWDNSNAHARDGGAENLREAFKQMLKDGIIYVPPKDAIFDFAAAVMDRDKVKAYELLENCYGVGESNMVLISVLYTNFRNLLQVQNCNLSSIAKSTGLNGFQIKTVKPYVNKYTDDELVDILKILNKVQRGIKTGEIPEEISTHYALVNIL